MATTPTIKKVNLTTADDYRREKMITYLKSRGMLSADAEKFIRQGK